MIPHRIELQGDLDLPGVGSLKQWGRMVLAELQDEATEVCVRLVTAVEMQSLNKQFRDQDKPTNVLSFASGERIEDDRIMLGDIVVCNEVVEAEALSQGKSVPAHLAHMLVHGILHLKGHDHLETKEAEAMESVEIALLRKLGFDNPYESS